MSQFFISAAHKSSGKTLVSVGLCAAYRRRGMRVAAFKKGPDYIDPAWLTKASINPNQHLIPECSLCVLCTLCGWLHRVSPRAAAWHFR